MNDTYYVASKYRTNPLSHEPAPDEVQIGNRIYNNIHDKSAYLAKCTEQEVVDEGYGSFSLAEIYGADGEFGLSEEAFIDSQTPDPKD